MYVVYFLLLVSFISFVFKVRNCEQFKMICSINGGSDERTNKNERIKNLHQCMIYLEDVPARVRLPTTFQMINEPCQNCF